MAARTWAAHTVAAFEARIAAVASEAGIAAAAARTWAAASEAGTAAEANHTAEAAAERTRAGPEEASRRQRWRQAAPHTQSQGSSKQNDKPKGSANSAVQPTIKQPPREQACFSLIVRVVDVPW